MDTKLIKSLMSERGIMQKELASRLSVSESLVSQWLTGAKEPNEGMLMRLADIFETTVDALLDAPEVDTPEAKATRDRIAAINAKAAEVKLLIAEKEAELRLKALEDQLARLACAPAVKFASPDSGDKIIATGARGRAIKARSYHERK